MECEASDPPVSRTRPSITGGGTDEEEAVQSVPGSPVAQAVSPQPDEQDSGLVSDNEEEKDDSDADNVSLEQVLPELADLHLEPDNDLPVHDEATDHPGVDDGLPPDLDDLLAEAEDDTEVPYAQLPVLARFKIWAKSLVQINMEHDVSVEATQATLNHVYAGIEMLYEFKTTKQRNPPQYKSIRRVATRKLPAMSLAVCHKVLAGDSEGQLVVDTNLPTYPHKKYGDRRQYKRMWQHLSVKVGNVFFSPTHA